MSDTIRISSMTGFARASGSSAAAGWSWEIKSVNGRSLDIRCRLPQGLERLDPAVRGAVSARLKRGNVTVGLRLSQALEAAAMRVNRAWLDELIELAAAYRANDAIAPPRLDGMLALRGVIEAAERPEDDAASAQDDAAMLETLDTALAELVRERLAEGVEIAAALDKRIAEIDALTHRAEALAPSRQEALGARLREQVAALVDAGAPVAEERLAAELAMLAVKIDVTEEIDRLKSHCRAAARHLQEDGAVGRKLDFLAQEFNREANTLCSKASHAALTDIGLALKAAIDQFREQVQNVE
ncbi:MAG: YicC family protein [Rhodospirillales bacterium]|nr:YicC family protein [Rhodospirillales bacterium]MDE0381769.1 YicC family protein [Rhodospirillales bacterium]